ncbi:MAG: HlyD family secretion protein [Verrucomicrobiota bacterium]|nr:HlyD family secretion protein [Verrucomicrobiota bacterium]
MSVVEAPQQPRRMTAATRRPNDPPAKAETPPVPADPPKKTPLFRRPTVIIAAAAIAIFGIVYGAFTMFHSFTHESTDDAFIDAHIIAIAPKIAGRVTAVHVTDNQMVKKGDPLIDIDPADADAFLAQKRAAVDVARAKARSAQTSAEQADAHLNTLHAGYEAAGASANAAAADTNKQRGDLERNARLITSGAISKQEFEHSSIDTAASQATLESKRKQMDAAAAFVKESEKQAQSAHVQVDAAKAEVAEAEATARQAELQLSYSKMTAPEEGRITTKAVESGAYVQVGQNLLALVTPNVWVTANLKETQLADIRPGQPVSIAVDAYPDRELQGHVDSVQAGSGSRFSLLPPENATGNYVKVVQRVPVKIVFDEQPDVQRVLGPGMSAVPDVTVKAGFGVAVTVGVIALIAIAIVILGAALWIGKSRLAR